MRFSPEFIERVRESNNIVDVISSYTQLRGSGTNRFMGLCPFHNEKTPSFSVSGEKQMYHCFGCKKAGNVYTFVQDMQGLSFPEAVEFLAQKANIPIPQEAYEKGSGSGDERREQQKMFFRINRYAAQVFHQNLMHLPPTHPVREYIHRRGLSPEIVTKFLIGYAPDEWESLAHSLEKKSVPLSEAEMVGLVKSRGQGKSGYYDVFRNRVIFPIVSPTENFLGFGGRIVGEGQPKYLNSPESPVFHKGRVFYGLNESAKYIRSQDQAVIVEGYTDFLALFQAGIKNVAATLGTALTGDHARLLKRYTKNVVVLFDGDQAGRQAAERSLPILLAEGLLPRGVFLESDYDPDEFIQEKGAQTLTARLANARELFIEVLEHDLQNFKGDATEKVVIMDKWGSILAKCADSRLRDLYVRELANRLRVETSWVLRAIKGESIEPKTADKVSTEAEALPPPKPAARIRVEKAPRAELFLLNAALMSEGEFARLIETEIVSWLSNPGISQIFARAEQLYRQKSCKFVNLMACLVDEVEPKEVLGLHLRPPLLDLQADGIEKLVADCVKKIREAHLKAKSKQLTANLKGEPADEAVKKLEQIMNIHKSRHSLHRES